MPAVLSILVSPAVKACLLLGIQININHTANYSFFLALFAPLDFFMTQKVKKRAGIIKIRKLDLQEKSGRGSEIYRQRRHRRR
jgi:hypothetical protein